VRRRSMTVELREDGRQPWLVVTGEIDLLNAGEFHDAVRRATSECPRLIVDLTGVTFLGSPAIATLYTYTGNLIAVLAAPGSYLAQTLTTAGFPMVITALPGLERPVTPGSCLP
jgi:anti-anti-sigma factor